MLNFLHVNDSVQVRTNGTTGTVSYFTLEAQISVYVKKITLVFYTIYCILDIVIDISN